MPRPRALPPRIFDLGANGSNREVPLLDVISPRDGEPDIATAVEVAPDVWVALMGVGTVRRTEGPRVQTFQGARLAVWGDDLERPLALRGFADALNIGLPTARWYMNEGLVPSFRTPGGATRTGDRRIHAAVARAIRAGVPLASLAEVQVRLRNGNGRVS